MHREARMFVRGPYVVTIVDLAPARFRIGPGQIKQRGPNSKETLFHYRIMWRACGITDLALENRRGEADWCLSRLQPKLFELEVVPQMLLFRTSTTHSACIISNN